MCSFICSGISADCLSDPRNRGRRYAIEAAHGRARRRSGRFGWWLPKLPPRLLRRRRFVFETHDLFRVTKSRIGKDDANPFVGVFPDCISVNVTGPVRVDHPPMNNAVTAGSGVRTAKVVSSLTRTDRSHPPHEGSSISSRAVLRTIGVREHSQLLGDCGSGSCCPKISVALVLGTTEGYSSSELYGTS
jgi:hypothetical protein